MAQGRCSAVLAMVAVVLVSAASVVQGAGYTVGDTEGWGVPDTPTFYANWASTKTFVAGDTLRFVYNSVAHDVLTVTQADYTSCALTSTNKLQTGNDTITLVAGVNSFLCGIPGHCSAGQKLSISVSAATPGSPLPITPPAPPTTSPDTTKNAASGTTVTIFQVLAAAMVSLVALLTL